MRTHRLLYPSLLLSLVVVGCSSSVQLTEHERVIASELHEGPHVVADLLEARGVRVESIARYTGVVNTTLFGRPAERWDVVLGIRVTDGFSGAARGQIAYAVYEDADAAALAARRLGAHLNPAPTRPSRFQGAPNFDGTYHPIVRSGRSAASVFQQENVIILYSGNDPLIVNVLSAATRGSEE